MHGKGVFALQAIAEGETIIEYVGEKITKKESTRRGLELEEQARKTGGAAVYIFTLNQKYDIDGGHAGNPARLINHSCEGNCEAYIIRGRIWIYSLREIKAGEELTYNYGFDVDTWDEHPCRCGTDRCVGFIVEEKQWPKLLRKLEKVERDAKNGKFKVNGTPAIVFEDGSFAPGMLSSDAIEAAHDQIVPHTGFQTRGQPGAAPDTGDNRCR